jgi:hypothetical protein
LVRRPICKRIHNPATQQQISTMWSNGSATGNKNDSHSVPTASDDFSGVSFAFDIVPTENAYMVRYKTVAIAKRNTK